MGRAVKRGSRVTCVEDGAFSATSERCEGGEKS
jgi:hypothetical protein